MTVAMHFPAWTRSQRVSGRETLDPIRLEIPIPSGRQLYVLFPADDTAFATREALKVVYHDPVSDAMVAIRPELEMGHK